MSKRYEISTEQKGVISAARKANKDKRVEASLKVLLLRAEGMSNAEISKETGYHISRISHLISMYRNGGLEAVADTICLLSAATIMSITCRAWICLFY